MYITAISTYSKDLYPNNNSSSFTNQLAEPIHLDSGKNYEIALAAISYNTNHIIEKEDLKFRLFDWKYQDPKTKLWGSYIDLQISHAVINNAQDLCANLNSLIWASIDRFRETKHEFFTYGKNHRIWVNFQKDMYVTIILKSNLILMLGCAKKDSKTSIIIVGKSKPKNQYTFNKEIRIFEDKRRLRSSAETRDYMSYPPLIGLSSEVIIYSDLVKNSHVASSMANVLKFVTIKKQRDTDLDNEREIVSFGADRTYQDLICKDIYHVQFELRSVTGEALKIKDYIRILIHIREK